MFYRPRIVNARWTNVQRVEVGRGVELEIRTTLRHREGARVEQGHYTTRFSLLDDDDSVLRFEELPLAVQEEVVAICRRHRKPSFSYIGRDGKRCGEVYELTSDDDSLDRLLSLM